MLIPLSWLKEYVDVKMPFKELAEKLSSAGLTVETWKEEEGDIIFDPEITPNRPDWMSVFGIAREISALTGAKLKDPNIKVEIKKIKNPLTINIKPNYDLVPRITSVIIKNVSVKPSPLWLQKRIKQIGLRPINNLVDITNYVLWTYGGLLHVFDYDKIRGKQMTIDQAKGGEAFKSLDGIDYILPKNAIIIKDVGRVIDLLPLKGGENTASYTNTKNVLLHSVIVDPILTRKTSQALGLRSDSSAIAERGLDPNITIKAVNHALSLILELAGGEIANEIMDYKSGDFKPWTVNVSHEKIENILGIKVDKNKIKEIFDSLGCHAELVSASYKVVIPTFRNDIHIEEDLIEEVGRVIGYNNFPKTLPNSAVPTEKVAYAHNYDLDFEVKQILKGAGYSEIYTYSLVSETQLQKLGITGIKLLNPISKDFEFLRPTLLGNLLDAVKLNLANFGDVRLYELGKEYSEKKENYYLYGILSGEKFLEAKGIVEKILTELGIKSEIVPAEILFSWLHPGRQAITKNDLGFIGEVHPRILTKWGIKERLTVWGLNYDLISKQAAKEKIYIPISKYPAIVEDLTITIPEDALIGEVINKIKLLSKLIIDVQLISTHERNFSFRITYQDQTKNLTDEDILPIRKKLEKNS